MKQKGITKKGVLCAVVLALVIPLTALVVKAIAASVTTNLTVVKGTDGNPLYEVETINGVVSIKAEYFHNSQATLSYDTKYLYFTKTSTGRNPTNGEYVAIDTSTINRYNYSDGSQTFEVFSVPVDRVYQVVMDLYGAEFVKDPENLDNLDLYLSQGFVLKRRNTAQDEWKVDVGPVYNTPAGIQGAAGWSFETRSNFQYYFDCQLKLNIRQYNITVEAGEGGTVGQSRYTAYLDEPVTINAFPDDNYNFTGWTVVEGTIPRFDSGAATTSFTMPDCDVVIRANFVKKNIPDPTKTPVPTPNPALPSPTPAPTPTPEPTPKPTYFPTTSTKENKMYSRYFTTDAGYSIGGIYDGTVNYTDETFGWLATVEGDMSSRIGTDFPAGKGSYLYEEGTADGSTWYFIPDGNKATYVHPKTYKGYNVDSADVRAITELTFPSSVTDSHGITYTVTSIGGGTNKYNDPFSDRTSLKGDFGDSRDEGDEERYYGKPSYGFYKLVNSYPQYGGTVRINDSREKRIGVIGNGSITSKASFTGNYSGGVTDIRNFQNSYYVYNTTLKFVTIPDTVTSIEAFAFYNCQALVRISGAEGVTDIGEYAFSAPSIVETAASEKKTYNADTGIYSYMYYVYNGSYSFSAPTATMQNFSEKTKISEYMSLPELADLKNICCYAFYNRTNLRDVVLPYTLELIYLYAFDGCLLDSITIPGKTTEILASSRWSWPDPTYKELYRTLGTKGDTADPKTLIITSPHSPTMDYGLVHNAYYDLRAGYPITYHSNTTPAETYASTTKMDVVKKMLRERVQVYKYTTNDTMGYEDYEFINNYEIYLDVDGMLWLDKKDKQPIPCMPEKTFYNIYAFEITSGYTGNYTTLHCCLAFSYDGTVWGYHPETATWQDLGIPEGSTCVTMSKRENSGGGQYGGQTKYNLTIYYLTPEGQIYTRPVCEINREWSTMGSSTNDVLQFDASCTPASVGMPSGVAAFYSISVEDYIQASGEFILSMPPTIYARDKQGGIWKHSTGSGWTSASTYQTYSSGHFDEDYTGVDLGPVVVAYKFYDTLYDCMFDTLGKEFVGWTLQPDGTGVLYRPGDELRVAAPTTVYAKWAGAAKKKIVYIPNGGVGVMEDDEYPADTPNPVTIRKNNPPEDGYTRNGYEFAGWSYKAEPGPSDVIYADGGQIVLALGTTRLYAQWTPITYKVKVGTEDMRVTGQTFTEHVMGLDTELTLGNLGDKTLTVSYNLNGKNEGQASMRRQPEFITELTDANKKALMAFSGWRLYEDTDGDGRITDEDMYMGYYSANTTVKNLTSKKDITLYFFPYWGGSASYVKLPEITCTGYHFIGFTPGTAYAPDYFVEEEALSDAIKSNILVMAPNGSGARYQPKADGEVLYAYYEAEDEEGGQAYGFEVYDVFGASVWDEIEKKELCYTVGVREDSGNIWDTLPLRTGVHPQYRNAGGLPYGGGISFRVRSRGSFAEADVTLAILPYLCIVTEEGYQEVDVYYEARMGKGTVLTKWMAEEQRLLLQASADSVVDEEGFERVWFGKFSLPQELWVTEQNTEVSEYQKRYGLDFTEEFWKESPRLMLRFCLCFVNSRGEQLYYGMVPEGSVDNVWKEEAIDSYREDMKGSKYEIQGGEVAVIYSGDYGDEEYTIHGIY